MDPDQTASIGAVCSGSTLFAFICNLSVMLGKYLQQTTSNRRQIQMHSFLGALRVNATFQSIRYHKAWNGQQSFVGRGGDIMFLKIV